MSKIIPILLISIMLSACAVTPSPTSTPTPEPLGTPTNPPQADCSVPTDWSIHYRRTGGIAGFNQSLTLSSNGDLKVRSRNPQATETKMISATQVKTISGLLTDACPFAEDSVKGTCADCFFYELTIQMDGQTYVIGASETALNEEMFSLIFTLDKFFPTAGQ
jgi:hypothetical protein